MSASNQIIQCKDRVEQILKTSTEARQSDKILWLAYLANNHNLIKRLGLDAYRRLQKVLRDPEIPSVETMGRIRRKLQEKGKYLTSNPDRKPHELKTKNALSNF